MQRFRSIIYDSKDRLKKGVCRSLCVLKLCHTCISYGILWIILSRPSLGGFEKFTKHCTGHAMSTCIKIIIMNSMKYWRKIHALIDRHMDMNMDMKCTCQVNTDAATHTEAWSSGFITQLTLFFISSKSTGLHRLVATLVLNSAHPFLCCSASPLQLPLPRHHEITHGPPPTWNAEKNGQEVYSRTPPS